MDLDKADLSAAAVNKTDGFVSNILLFSVRSIVNPMTFTLANFATKL